MAHVAEMLRWHSVDATPHHATNARDSAMEYQVHLTHSPARYLWAGSIDCMESTEGRWKATT